MEETAIVKGKYRYSLKKEWNAHNVRKAVFVLLHPGMEDSHIDARTVQRCVTFAKRLDCGSVEIVNVFAYRCCDSQTLSDLSLEEATGAENQFYVENALYSSAIIIVGWGRHCKVHYKNYDQLSTWFRKYPLYCFGTTEDGHPLHPLYVKSDTKMSTFHFP